jgi:hypothetical protein
MGKSLDELIGKIAKGIDADGNERDLFWPKVEEIKVLGFRIPLYASEPRFTRNKRTTLYDRIRKFYGFERIIVKKNKVYGIKRVTSKEE